MSKSILIIEDDDSIRALLERALKPRYAIESIPDGTQALARIGQGQATDLVICDLMLPGCDGFQIVKSMKGSPAWQKTPVIMLTARSSPKDVISGIQAGVRHYVTKPFKLDDLMGKVTKILGSG